MQTRTVGYHSREESIKDLDGGSGDDCWSKVCKIRKQILKVPSNWQGLRHCLMMQLHCYKRTPIVRDHLFAPRVVAKGLAPSQLHSSFLKYESLRIKKSLKKRQRKFCHYKDISTIIFTSLSEIKKRKWMEEKVMCSIFSIWEHVDEM